MNYREFNLVCYALMQAYYAEKEPISKEAAKVLFGSEGATAGKIYPPIAGAISAIRNQDTERFADYLADFGQVLKQEQRRWERDPNLSMPQIRVLKAWGTWMRTDSESAFRALDKVAVNMKLPWINQFFAKEIRSQKPLRKELETFVKRITGEKRDYLEADEVQDLRKNPEVYRKYLRMRRDMNQIGKDAIATFVRNSGKNLVPIKAVLDFLKDQGMDNPWPEGFTGKIDSQGRWYTEEGKQIDGVPSKVMFPKVKMNEGSNDNWVFVAVRSDGTAGNYFYTTDYKGEKRDKKFNAVKVLIQRIRGMRQKWRPHILNFDDSDVDSVTALLLEMSYMYATRIGTPGNTTQGLSTIQAKHVTFRSNGEVLISYRGKDGVQNKHIVRNNVTERPIAKALSVLCKSLGPKDQVFAVRMSNGDRRAVRPSKVNQAFKSYGAPEGTTIHKLRTLRATKMMEKELEGLYKRKDYYIKAANFFKDLESIAVTIGKALNHMRTKNGKEQATGATALANYIDPGLIVEACNHYKIAHPAWLAKLVNRN